MDMHRRHLLRAALGSMIGVGSLPLEVAGQSTQNRGAKPRKGEQKRIPSGPGKLGPDDLDPIIRKWKDEHQIVGATLAVAKDGRLVHAQGYGFCDLEEQQPVSPRILFSLGSVTKAVTAVAALRLADHGKLALDSTIVDLYADLNPANQAPLDPLFHGITVRQLLSHTSGIPDRVPKARRGGLNEDDDDTVEQAVVMYRNAYGMKLDFAPGTEHRYSNSGYVIVRLAIERAAGQDYEPFVIERVLKPMGIEHMLLERADYVAGETKRYVNAPKGPRLAMHAINNWLATPTDLLKFLTSARGVRGKPFLSPGAVSQMLAPPPPPLKLSKNGSHVGLGWDSVRRAEGGFRYSKNGGKPGVRAWLEHLPNGVDWAFMFNTSEPVGAKSEPNKPKALHTAAERIGTALLERKRWPEIDLFARDA